MSEPPAGRLLLGWQYAVPCPAPGPPPRRPTPPERERIVPGWVTAQRREENRLSRPLKALCGLCLVAVVASAALGLAGTLGGVAAGFIAGCAALLAAVSGNSVWQGERALRARVAGELRRVESIRAESDSRLFAWQAEHAGRVREWQARHLAYVHQKRWYAVTAPDGVGRVDVAGGTLSGWSALLTTAAAHLLADGGEVTVIDLTESAVALDLIALARDPLVWVLPADLARLDLGRGLDGAALADVLSLAVSATDEQASTQDLASANAILERVIDVLGGAASIASIAAALRTLGQVGDPADDVAAGLISAEQADRLRVLFGERAADRVVIERAWAMESQLRKLASLGSASSPERRSDLRVLALGRQTGVLDGKVLGVFLAVALTYALRRPEAQANPAEPGRAWRHTVFLLGADRLRGDVLDRLCDACENTGTGLVLGFRTIGPGVRERLGRGGAAVAFMRLGNAEEAKAASEQIGTEHRFVLSQLTETVGRSVTDTTTGSYTSTLGLSGTRTRSRSESLGSARTTSRGRTEQGGPVPLGGAGTSRSDQASESWTISDAESVGTGISASTAWGQTTSAADGTSESLSMAAQRSREFLVEQHELQQLPASALIMSYPGPGGREVVLADANPGIASLRTATMHTLDEFRTFPAAAVPVSPGAERDDPRKAAPPNLGPPPERLDWRRGRRPRPI